ncbi:MAG: flagellar filament capping protein FliD [Lachnospiraceae bacterium]|nr:flagellar filament capping protein FliD [Lachnospiraceae bacterium]
MAINTNVLSSVYNFYQADLVPRSTSNKYDSHKKKDLQDIYKSIVRLSKDEPVFLMDRSREVEQYTIHMKENAMLFRNRVASMGGLEDGQMFSQKTAYSSDPEEAEIIDSATDDAAKEGEVPEEYRLKIEQLAGPQVNAGKFLPEDENNLAEGNYSFDISTMNSNYELQFSISPEDTNKGIQNRLARLINNFNLGLHAQVEKDGMGNSALVISSNAIGEKGGNGHFSISDEDTSQTGGIVDYLGIRKITEEGKNAVYTVNGEQYTAPGNDVNIGGFYNVRLKEVTEEGREVTLGIKPDFESVRDNIVSLTGSYNDFVKAAAEYVDQQPRTNLLVNYMKNTSYFYTSSLADMGVTQEEDGTLSVDEEKLGETLKDGNVEEQLGKLKSFTKFAMRKANEVQLNPMDYVDKRIVAYKNPTKPHYANPYITSAYSGMLFNGYM